ncbi:response regulator transcription factor [Aquincola tertiaricarbonis]|uniref:Response regulator transcription factor n=1 Tax=Aquincola tertiaricarbonis TaxID=391953 RepID=A0ABY4S4C0_AQUTE|nr:response regulator transcription factor [Aquincola tertiaricarbonis]URI08281.1 response regulator transcription factor [Aquincola tertiaricarbonis]
MIRVLLADDHPVVRSGYQRLLALEPDLRVVAEAADADAAYAAYLQHQPDVVVTDLTMPGGGGLDLIRRVLRREPRARVLVFSMHDSPTLVRQALASGARGFLTKASAPESLVDAVRALARGERYLAAELPAWLLDAPATGQADADSGLAALSSREFEIFRLLAQGASATECAQALKLSPKTVSNHQTVIKEKLGVSTTAALVHLALRHGVIGHGAPGGSGQSSSPGTSLAPIQ